MKSCGSRSIAVLLGIKQVHIGVQGHLVCTWTVQRKYRVRTCRDDRRNSALLLPLVAPHENKTNDTTSGWVTLFGQSMEFHGVRWRYMEADETPWNSMELHGYPRNSMELEMHGSSHENFRCRLLGCFSWKPCLMKLHGKWLLNFHGNCREVNVLWKIPRGYPWNSVGVEHYPPRCF